MTVSEQVDETIHFELLAGAVSCARGLKLEGRGFMCTENTSSKDRDFAKRSLWYLYSIEVPHSLRRGISPVGVSFTLLLEKKSLSNDNTNRY